MSKTRTNLGKAINTSMGRDSFVGAVRVNPSAGLRIVVGLDRARLSCSRGLYIGSRFYTACRVIFCCHGLRCRRRHGIWYVVIEGDNRPWRTCYEVDSTFVNARRARHYIYVVHKGDH